MTILVTGAAGYVGSHTALRMLRLGHTVVGFDNYSTGLRDRSIRLARSADTLPGDFHMVEGDIADTDLVAQTLAEHRIDSVIHLAAHCIVSESVREPDKYHRNNTLGAASLLAACAPSGVARFILSSTTSVYGDPDLGMTPIPESTPCHPINPYGASKLACERLLAEHAQTRHAAGRPFAGAALRYFNVAGCEPELGEQSNDAGRLIPTAINVALGRQPALTICGSDFPTPDGTCVRDYIDVRDIAAAHADVLDALKPGNQRTYNVGMGRGWSVREVAQATARVSGHPIPTIEGPRREGDPAALVADVTKIAQEIGWVAKHTDLGEIIATALEWASTKWR